MAVAALLLVITVTVGVVAERGFNDQTGWGVPPRSSGGVVSVTPTETLPDATPDHPPRRAGIRPTPRYPCVVPTNTPAPTVPPTVPPTTTAVSPRPPSSSTSDDHHDRSGPPRATPPSVEPRGTYEVWVTHYGFESCDDPECYTASGIIAGTALPDGAQTAACGYFLEMGTRFIFQDTLYACVDRGGGPHYWIDLWLGTFTGQAVIEVLP